MNRKLIIIPAVMLLFGAQAVFAQAEYDYDATLEFAIEADYYGEEAAFAEADYEYNAYEEVAFAEADYEYDAYEEVAFVEADYEYYAFEEVAFAEADYEYAAFEEIALAETDYEDAAFEEVAVAEADYEDAAFEEAALAEADIPSRIRHNRFFFEARRLTNLAQQAYDEGDFLASIQFSEEAVRFSLLSDEFVRLQVIIWQTDNAIAAALARLNFATAAEAARRFPSEYGLAQTTLSQARAYRVAEEWSDATISARRVLEILANVTALPPPGEPEVRPLPAQYTVRDWRQTRDSLWYIAGLPWVFNDPWQWRRLYEANRDIMPEPGNPNLIHPGMVLNIPSIRGEVRQGMWEPGVEYPPLP